MADELSYVFSIPSHPTRYHLTPVLNLYGERFCTSLSRAWKIIFGDKFTGNTSYRYFQYTVSALVWIAGKAASLKDGPEVRVFAACAKGRQSLLPASDIEACLANMFDSLCDGSDESLSRAKKAVAINSSIESIRAGFGHLADAGFFPYHEFSASVPEMAGSQTPSIATLLIDAGRFDLSGMDAETAPEAFAAKNVEGLKALRSSLCDEFENEWRAFTWGQELMEDPKIPSGEETSEILKDYVGIGTVDVKEWLKEKLGLNDDQYLGLVAKFIRDRNRRDFKYSLKKFYRLIKSAGGHYAVHRLVMPSSIAANAAYHIVVIDTVLNDSSVASLPAELFTGKLKRGSVEINTLHTHKSRKNGHRKNVVTASVKSTAVAENDDTLFVSTRFKRQLSFKTVIDRWLKMTETIRENPRVSAALKKLLWIYQRPGQQRVRTIAHSIMTEWWPAFLTRISGDPLLGGLPLTRMVIRKTALNGKAELDDLQYAVNTGLGNHAPGPMPFYYMDERGVKSVLASLIRKFLDKWEAVAVGGIERAAEALGLSQRDLDRRFQLGLRSGLDFANVRPRAETAPPEDVETMSFLPDSVRLLPVTEASMSNLHLARRTLETKMQEMLHTNPERFIRAWVPWLAIVQVYEEKLRESRFAKAFETICIAIDSGLESGAVEPLYIW
ncbi:hypothetical protein [Rhizobium johnstonii]|uniref:hypothetical protein n=1 Tax=Rhizobium johnstonii TaxID=3019933 RepID=UPI003F9E1D8C